MVKQIHKAQEPQINLRTSNDQNPANRVTAKNSNTSDEIIISLANTYENKRARQVNEWERVQSSTSKSIT